MFIFLRGCTRLQPVTMQESVCAWSTSCGVIVYCYFYVFRLISKTIYCLLLYFLFNYANFIRYGTWMTYENKNMTKLRRHWVNEWQVLSQSHQSRSHSTLHSRHKVVAVAVASQLHHSRNCEQRFIMCVVVSRGPWVDHVAGYWDHRSDNNMLFLVFEDMIQVVNLVLSWRYGDGVDNTVEENSSDFSLTRMRKSTRACGQ